METTHAIDESLEQTYEKVKKHVDPKTGIIPWVRAS